MQNRLIARVISVSNYKPKGRGFDSPYFHNFKSVLDLKQGPPSLVRSLGSYSIEK